MEYFTITILIPAAVSALALTSAALMILHPRKYVVAETMNSILEDIEKPVIDESVFEID